MFAVAKFFESPVKGYRRVVADEETCWCASSIVQRCGLRGERRADSSGPLQFSLKDLADQAGVGLTLRQFHHLAFEKVKGGNVARSEVRNGFRMRRDDLIAKRFDGVYRLTARYPSPDDRGR